MHDFIYILRISLRLLWINNRQEWGAKVEAGRPLKRLLSPLSLDEEGEARSGPGCSLQVETVAFADTPNVGHEGSQG